MAYLKHFLRLLVVFLLLTALQASSVIITANEADASYQVKQKQPAAQEEYAQKIESLGIKLRPGTDHRADSKPTFRTAQRCESLVYQTLNELQGAHRKLITELTLFYTADGRRGLGGSGGIVLRCLNVSDPELVAV